MSATTQLVNACRKVGLITSVVLLAACGGDDGDVAAPIDSTTPPGAVAPVPSTSAATPTPTGTASGAATSVTIGAAGGSLSSADGRMTVAIPAGALAAGTVIGIQPITNNAHGGVGTGYRLTPDGQAFAQPVVLSFAYADQDLAGSDPETLGAAFQTSTGYWQWMGKPVIDSTANTMKISTTHFTDIVLVKGFHLVPENKTLGINESLALRVVLCYRNAVLENDLQPLGLPCTTADVNPDNSIVDVVDWSVNGAAGGDATYGTVGGSGPNATYRAPAAKPARNLVSVSARVIRGDGQKFKVASNVTIGGDTAYAGTVSFNLNLGEGGVLVSNAVATVTWVLFEDLGDVRRYVPTGTITAETISVSGCDPLSNVTVPIDATVPGAPGPTLVVYTASNAAFAKSYQFTLAADPKTRLTFTCGEGANRVSVPSPAPISFAVGICESSDFPKFTDEAHLAGSYQCAKTGLSSARWDLNR